MTPQESAKSKAAVMLAFAEGKAIEQRYAKSGPSVYDDMDNPWRPCGGGTPGWNWCILEYRLKPIPREFWVNIYKDGLSDDIFESRDRADQNAISSRTECIRVREVL